MGLATKLNIYKKKKEVEYYFRKYVFEEIWERTW